MKKLTTAQLVKIFAGELLKLSQHPKYRKKMEKLERQKHNEKVKDMYDKGSKPEQPEHDGFDLSPGWQERQTKQKIKNIKDVVDLGRGDFGEEDPFTVQFYLLPAKQFGKANVGPSSNLLDPDERDIWDSINRIDLNYHTVAIYSDDLKKYEDMVDKILKESESGKYTA